MVFEAAISDRFPGSKARGHGSVIQQLKTSEQSSGGCRGRSGNDGATSSGVTRSEVTGAWTAPSTYPFPRETVVSDQSPATGDRERACSLITDRWPLITEG